ncbi:MAG: ChaN family lipoprotein [Candidatus Magasanikbacteria bacterium]|nr:ChaN family lipoprotein [Candidatus Magasanikbacteria bacterium]
MVLDVLEQRPDVWAAREQLKEKNLNRLQQVHADMDSRLSKYFDKEHGDPVEDTAYLKEFKQECGQYQAVVNLNEVLAAAQEAQIVFGGDLHHSVETQAVLSRIITLLSRGPDKPAVGLEFIRIGADEAVNQYLNGQIDIDTFAQQGGLKEFLPAEKIDGYKQLLSVIKERGLRVIPLGSWRKQRKIKDPDQSLRLADEMAARELAKAISAAPDQKIIVVFGQAHLAGTHLPQATQEHVGHDLKTVTLIQNHEPIILELLRKRGQLQPAVKIKENTYGLQSSSPVKTRLDQVKHYHPPEDTSEDEEGVYETQTTKILREVLSSCAQLTGANISKQNLTYKEGRSLQRISRFFESIEVRRIEDYTEQLTDTQKQELREGGVTLSIMDAMPVLIIHKDDSAALIKFTARLFVQALRGELSQSGSDASVSPDTAARAFALTKLLAPEMKPRDGAAVELEGQETWKKIIRGESGIDAVIK